MGLYLRAITCNSYCQNKSDGQTLHRITQLIVEQAILTGDDYSRFGVGSAVQPSVSVRTARLIKTTSSTSRAWSRHRSERPDGSQQYIVHVRVEVKN